MGVDIGGTHITCALVDLQQGHLVPQSRTRVRIQHTESAPHIFERWAEAMHKTLSKRQGSPILGIGFAIPGPFDYRNGVSNMAHKFSALQGLHIPTHLQALLQTAAPLPMRFLNDAAAFAIGESWVGEGKGHQKVVVVTLGTGFGSAFTAGGIPIVTGESVPKEGCLWHLPYGGSIADDHFSTRWFVGEYLKRAGKSIAGVKELSEKAADSREIKAIFDLYGQNLAQFLAEPLQRFEAEVLVIGGNISHALPLFQETFQQGLKQANISVKVAVSTLKEKAALLGSARLLDDSFWAKVSRELPNV